MVESSRRALVDLAGRRALVTGGSRGIGAATARLLAQAGADVAITYETRTANAEAVRAEIEESGRRGLALQAGLAERADCERVVAQTVAEFGDLDIFVANAGIWTARDIPVSEMTEDHWRRTIAVNLDSVFYGCRAALRVMTGNGERGRGKGKAVGRIVIVSSTAGQRGEAYHADYAASKGAIISLVKSLAVEAAPVVTVNGVAPGWVDTEMARVPYEREEGLGRREIEASIPLGRVAAPEEIAGPIVFLCSNLARHITGEILNVNGGSVLCG